MEVPAQIDIQGIEASEAVKDAIAGHIAGLEKRFGRITACRVALRAPGGHHRTGGLYEVNVWLSLPDGREVAVVRTPPQDERFADLDFAINDAFKRARRRLQDKVRRLQGAVKLHTEQPVGTVTRLEPEASFGFLESGDGRAIYFHRNSVLDDKFGRLKVGTRVTFAEEEGEKGPQASTVKLLGRHGLRV